MKIKVFSLIFFLPFLFSCGTPEIATSNNTQSSSETSSESTTSSTNSTSDVKDTTSNEDTLLVKSEFSTELKLAIMPAIGSLIPTFVGFESPEYQTGTTGGVPYINLYKYNDFSNDFISQYVSFITSYGFTYLTSDTDEGVEWSEYINESQMWIRFSYYLSDDGKNVFDLYAQNENAYDGGLMANKEPSLKLEPNDFTTSYEEEKTITKDRYTLSYYNVINFKTNNIIQMKKGMGYIKNSEVLQSYSLIYIELYNSSYEYLKFEVSDGNNNYTIHTFNGFYFLNDFNTFKISAKNQEAIKIGHIDFYI